MSVDHCTIEFEKEVGNTEMGLNNLEFQPKKDSHFNEKKSIIKENTIFKSCKMDQIKYCIIKNLLSCPVLYEKNR